MLIPLRAFLGLTFIYAGLQKLADRWFFSASAPSSIQAQLHRAAQTSPIGGLLGGVAHHAVVVGMVIALAEVGVGLGALLGLWTRIAAAAGALLSLGFLLAVSWHTRPFYYGADVVFLFAWTPLIIAGGGPLSIDGMTRADARQRLGLPSDPAVIVGFDTVRRLCGSYDDGRCRARRDHRCSPDGCPVLAVPEAVAVDGELDRRTFMQKAGVAGWLATAAVVGGGVVALIGRVVPPSKARRVAAPSLADAAAASTSAAPPTAPAGSTATTAPADTSPSSSTAPTSGAPASTPPPSAAPATTAPPATTAAPAPAPAGMTALGPAQAVTVGGAASFSDPATGDPAFVVQPTAGRYLAFDATCTHQGCPVQFSGTRFECPCHGAQFDATTGEVLQGPATSPLRKITIKEAGGTLYAK